jgi:hypothetical protein
VVDAKANSRFVDHARHLRPFDVVFGGVGGQIRSGYNNQMLFHLYKIIYENPEETVVNGLWRYNISVKPVLDKLQAKVLDVKIRNTVSGSDYV